MVISTLIELPRRGRLEGMEIKFIVIGNLIKHAAMNVD